MRTFSGLMVLAWIVVTIALMATDQEWGVACAHLIAWSAMFKAFEPR